MRTWIKPGLAGLFTLLATVPSLGAEFAVVGTGDGIELLQAVASAFNADHEGMSAVVPPSIGSGGAVAAVGADRHKLGRVARQLTDAERAQGLQEAPLVRMPSAVFVHPDAGLRSLTSAQLAAIFSGQVENWSELGGADLKVRVVRREETDSTLIVLRASMPGWKDLALTSRSKMATTTQDAVETVKRVPGAIGFGPYSRALEDGATVLAIDGKHPLDAQYPSAVTLSLIYKEASLDENARAFLNFAKSSKARKVLVDGGGVPLNR
jgi:phosphate transport system substrate-binding protein